MPRPRVMGLDISANRVAFAVCDSVEFMGSRLMRRKNWPTLGAFAEDAASLIRGGRQMCGLPSVCMEINTRPKIMHKGKPSPNMVLSYMRSRWVEGAIIAMCAEDEPGMIKRLKGGYWEIPTDSTWFALQASSGKNEKENRRRRMSTIYGFKLGKISQDEVDALAIAHECSIALNMGRGMSRGGRST